MNNARKTNAAVRNALFVGDAEGARETFNRYVESSATEHGMSVRMGLLFRLGLTQHGARIVEWRSHPAYAEIAAHHPRRARA